MGDLKRHDEVRIKLGAAKAEIAHHDMEVKALKLVLFCLAVHFNEDRLSPGPIKGDLLLGNQSSPLDFLDTSQRNRRPAPRRPNLLQSAGR